jgi:hypothetical protein
MPDAEHDRLAIDDELIVLVLQRRLDDPGITESTNSAPCPKRWWGSFCMESG